MSWSPPDHDRSREIRDHLPADGWRLAIREICVRHGVEADRLQPFASGSDVVWAADSWVVKLTAPCFRAEIEAEARCLDHVSGRLRVQTPEVRAVGELGGWPYVVMSRVSGIALGEAWGKLDHRERARLAADLGRLVRELHELTPPEGPDGWDAFWRACRTGVAARHRREGVPEALVAGIEPFLEEVGKLDEEGRVLLHTEVLDQHVLVEERDGRFEPSALIDFADGRVGPVEYEFPAPVDFVFKGERGLLRGFLLAYGIPAHDLDRERSRRMLAWSLCHRFGNLGRMLAAIAPERPESLDDLARRLFDLEAP